MLGLPDVNVLVAMILPEHARRLGYLLEHFNHRRQATALRPFIGATKSMKPLDPSVKRIAALGAAAGAADEAPSWKLILNAPVEIDA